jgi:hypothetical protein
MSIDQRMKEASELGADDGNLHGFRSEGERNLNF